MAERDVDRMVARFDAILTRMGDRVVCLPDRNGAMRWEHAREHDDEAKAEARRLNAITDQMHDAGYRRLTMGGKAAWIGDTPAPSVREGT